MPKRKRQEPSIEREQEAYLARRPLFAHLTEGQPDCESDLILEAALACFRKGAQSTPEFRPGVQKLLDYITYTNEQFQLIFKSKAGTRYKQSN